MKWYQNKFFWITAIGVILAVLNQILTGNFLPQYAGDITLTIVILTALSNALAGNQTLTANAKLKRQLSVALGHKSSD
jgi:hypothetical protein